MPRAQLLDIEENQEDLETSEEQQTLEAVQQEPQEEPQEPDLPEKYRDKSVQELVQMHQEAEKAIGKQGSEVGELRKIVDSYIKSQIVEKAPPPQKVEEEEDFDWFTDPDKALEQKLANHPTLKNLEQREVMNARQSSQEALRSKHPDYADICADSKFVDWIKGSKTRQRLFVEADQQFNADSADELFSTWKERQALANAQVEVDKTVRRDEVKAASTGDTRGSGAPSAKKRYRRSDIINLKIENPDRYQQLAPEILLAYKEGRVV